ncbi:hypothetical protein BGX38DRAFT_1205076 [Terfezia claveryi]|nr:hypothetical protein BGX38DRAFT_1205076 [Terfezia claveryi]
MLMKSDLRTKFKRLVPTSRSKGHQIRSVSFNDPTFNRIPILPVSPTSPGSWPSLHAQALQSLPRFRQSYVYGLSTQHTPTSSNYLARCTSEPNMGTFGDILTGDGREFAWDFELWGLAQSTPAVSSVGHASEILEHKVQLDYEHGGTIGPTNNERDVEEIVEEDNGEDDEAGKEDNCSQTLASLHEVLPNMDTPSQPTPTEQLAVPQQAFYLPSLAASKPMPEIDGEGYPFLWNFNYEWP